MSVTVLTVKVGPGYSEREMEQVESLFERNGLSRSEQILNGKSMPRLIDHGVLSSTFRSNNKSWFGGSVMLRESDGLLSFDLFQLGAERFAEPTQRCVTGIVEQSQQIFGQGITVKLEIKHGNL